MRKYIPLILVAMAATASPNAYGQLDCNVVRLEEAHSRFDLGLIDETFTLLNPCVPDGFDQRELRIDAYRLMALSATVHRLRPVVQTQLVQLVMEGQTVVPLDGPGADRRCGCGCTSADQV